MGSRTLPILRIPLMLLASVNLGILGMRLWPWQDARNLPVNGTTALDPAICLLAYIVFLFWMGGNRNDGIRKALGFGTLFGLLAGLPLIAYAVLDVQSPAARSGSMLIGLLAAAGLVCGVAGVRGALAGGTGVGGMVTGVWCAMVGCLMGSTAVLAEINLAGPAPVTQDPWKQYEGLAIGNQAIQSLVHSLNTATGFLLIGPLVGGALGIVFSFFGPNLDK